MAKLSTHGDFPVDLIESAKAELAGELNFSEEQEPSTRSGAGYPSLGNVLGHGFDFGEPPVSNFYDEDLRRLRDQLKIVSNNIGRGNDYGSKARAAELRLEIRDKLAQHKRNVAAAQAAVGEPEPEGSSMEVETDNRGALIPDYNESAQEALDFARCQRPNGTFYGTAGICKSGSPVGAKEKEAPKGRAKAAPKAKAEPKAAGKEAPKSEVKATQANVRKLDKAAKAADKKADAADKKFQAEYKKAQKVEAKAAQAQAALRKDPQNQAKKDAFRVANMDARNAMDKVRILQKQTRKLDREAKALNRAANKLDKEFQKSIKK